MKTATSSLAAWRGPATYLGLFVFRLHLGVIMVLGALLIAVPAVAGGSFGPIHSDLTIEPGKQFILGGGQGGAFRVSAKNTGTVAVEIKERLRGGGIFGKTTLAPGQRGVLRFAAGSTAVLLNPSATNARLDLTITGDTDLRMDYEPVRTSSTVPAPRLTESELSEAMGQWQGSLTYLDYSSGKTVKLNTTMRGEMAGPNQLLLHFDYEEPNKRHVLGTDTLTLARDGAHMRWDKSDFTIQAKQWLPEQTLRLVLEGPGQDDNRPATIRKTITLGRHQFYVKKEVSFSNGQASLQRHEYQFNR
ncbi:hypothetical protein Q3A66_11730 [Hymenobacter sp. BT770]|uniref:hypothetical protein n=1 Tax=Hymenobacter sp. BT770 TaxID=2886942 RepID=UPI001D0F60F7|nr:hypothetical protein [Hymenobacter sp. BT770]MCC3153501.1 hypothetical protein [Hymenobacter sp. BT770]MDO3415738.1 hypothetical protein [Hymenobacter sp. BT770]